LYPSGRKRHLRRCNNEIAKVHECPYFGCDKTYGSEGSLNLHMKIKHKAGSKTWREKFARDLILTIRETRGIAEDSMHKMQYLPPGLIQACAQEIGFLENFLGSEGYAKVRERIGRFLEVKPGMAFYQLAAPGGEEEETDMILK